MARVGSYWWGGVALSLVALFSGASLGSTTPEASFPDCVVQGFENLGNGYCDGNLNHAACGYDLGDCCPCTCREHQDNGCGASGYHCVDPAAGCVEDPAVASPLRGLQEQGDGDISTFAPTSAPSGVPGLVPSAAPTSFINAESIAAAASKLSSGEIGGIVVACLVVALILAGIYFYKKKHSGGDNMDYSSAEMATLT
eukprot:g15406.t1